MRNSFKYPVLLSLPAFTVAFACGEVTPDGSLNESAAGAAGDSIGESAGAGGDKSSEPASGGALSGDSGQGGGHELETAGAGGEPARGASACDSSCGDRETCCDGECVDLDSDAANCGGCGKVCDAPHATAECVASECVIAKCGDGYVDCNQRWRDGCEARDTRLPGAPALASPGLGAYTGSVHAESALRPRFRVAAASVAGSCPRAARRRLSGRQRSRASRRARRRSMRSCDSDELIQWSIKSSVVPVIQAGVNTFGDARPNGSLFGQSAARASWTLVIPSGMSSPANSELDLEHIDDIVLKTTHRALPKRSGAVPLDVPCLGRVGAGG
jgi:hypothetical protein